MNKTLLKDIQVEIKKITGCAILPDDEGNKLILSLVDIFSFDISKCWMWDNKHYAEIHDCSGSPWEPVLKGLLTKFNRWILLVVTDDEFFPWKVLHLKNDDCITLLRELPNFEYFIFDDTMKAVVFETHHNSFILFE